MREGGRKTGEGGGREGGSKEGRCHISVSKIDFTWSWEIV